jgi:hypothetical protein
MSAFTGNYPTTKQHMDVFLKTAVFKYIVGEREMFWESKVDIKPKCQVNPYTT